MIRPSVSPFEVVSRTVDAALTLERATLRSGSVLATGLASVVESDLVRELSDLSRDAALTAASRSHDDFCNALKSWGHDLVDIAELVLSPLVAAGVAGTQAVEVLVVELLRWKLPRLAGMMGAAGVFVDNPTLGSSFDFDKLRQFLLSTPELVDERFWDQLFDSNGIDMSGRMPALLAALLIVAPQTISALGNDDLRIAGLESPLVSADGSSQWKDLRAHTAGWLSITVPFVDDAGNLVRPGLPDLADGLVPDQVVSLLIRSQRRAGAGRNVTDFEMWVQPSVDAAKLDVPLPGGFVASLEPLVRTGFGYDGNTGRWNAAVEPRAGSLIAATVSEATLSIEHPDDGSPDILLGAPSETRFVIRDLGLTVRTRALGEPSIEMIARANGFGVVLTNRWFRSLGESMTALRDGLRLDVDLTARLAEGSSFSLAADGVIETRIVIGKKWKLKALTVQIHSLVVRVPIRADQNHFDIRGEVLPHLSATLGPHVTFVMDGAGGWVGWWADQPGGAKECIGLVPPTGLGFQLDFSGVTAGGFLDFRGGPTERYAGAVTFALKPPAVSRGVAITAFGVHELVGPVNAAVKDRSFVIVLGITWRPGFVFGPGIIWFGAGGVYGHDRRADVDALRERLTAGAVGNVLFADDPIRNAPLILADINAIFPPQSGVHVFGLTIQLGWVPLFDDYFIRLALGVIIEYHDGSITKILILGSLRISPPKLEKVLDIQVDAFGVIDVGRKTIDIDVTIRRGKAFGVFNITGDGGLRASWGSQPYLMATLGGFHPDFNPEPAVFPKLRRVLLTFYKEDLPGPIDELSANGFLAVTSNTLQAGVELKAVIKTGNWKIEGTIGGEALIRLPFYFDISIHGSVSVKYRGHGLEISFNGGLSGPSPITLRGEVCVSLLLCDACWGDSIELGGGQDLASPVIASLVPVLAVELSLASNISVASPDDPHVLVVRRGDSARFVLSPLAGPTWSQNRVPLGLEVETFEAGKLDNPQRLEVNASRPSSPHRELFSPGSFVELSDAERMALPAFEEHQAGVVIAADATRSTGVVVAASVIEIRLPDTSHPGDLFDIPDHVVDRLDAREGPTTVRPRPGRFGVGAQSFEVIGATGVVETAGLTAVQARLAGRKAGRAVQHLTDKRVSVVL